MHILATGLVLVGLALPHHAGATDYLIEAGTTKAWEDAVFVDVSRIVRRGNYRDVWITYVWNGAEIRDDIKVSLALDRVSCSEHTYVELSATGYLSSGEPAGSWDLGSTAPTVKYIVPETTMDAIANLACLNRPLKNPESKGFRPLPQGIKPEEFADRMYAEATSGNSKLTK